MKSLTITVAILFLSGCVTAQLASQQMRRAEYRHDTGKNPDQAFMAIRVALARGFGDASKAIKLDDAKNRIIIAHGNVPCTALKMGNGFATGERAEFLLSIKISDQGTLAVDFENVVMMADTAWDMGLRPSNASDMNQVADECLKPVFDNLKLEVSK